MNNFVPAQSEFLCQKEREARYKSKRGELEKQKDTKFCTRSNNFHLQRDLRQEMIFHNHSGKARH